VDVTLAGTTIFTRPTFFVHNYWQLCIVRALASGLAYTELAISITLVNESLPSDRRGLYYSIVQAGWPLGVMCAAIIYLVTIQLGWHFLFVFGVAPFAIVVIGRIWIREPERFRRIRAIREAHRSGDREKTERLTREYHIPLDHARSHSFAELFGTDQKRQTILLMIAFFFMEQVSLRRIFTLSIG
jgi:MFS family permease